MTGGGVMQHPDASDGTMPPAIQALARAIEGS
jgi:hypothetical protein